MLGLRPIGAAAIGVSIVLGAPVLPAGVVLETGGTSSQANTSSVGAAGVTSAGGAPKTVNETGAGSTQANAGSSGAAGVTPAGSTPKTVNETGANSTQSNNSTTGGATVTPAGIQQPIPTVPASRTAVFAYKRVAVFKDAGPVTLKKVPADELYFVGDFTKPLADGATSAVSVAPVVSGVDVLEGPEVQGSLMVVKLGTLDPAGGQLTFRVTCANGEIIDGTIILEPLDDRSQTFGKDPNDRRWYALDVSGDLTLSGNPSMTHLQQPVTDGVVSLATPPKQGGKVFVLLGGLDLSHNAANSCTLTMTLATTEVINRTIYLSRQDH
jgi:hypothetical protein